MPTAQAERPRVLLGGRGLVECPRWHDGHIWFADWSAGEILKVGAGGAAQVVARAPAPPLSFEFAADGRMLVVNAHELRVYAREPDGALTPFAELPKGLGNEIVVDGRGNAYVDGAGFDVMAGEPPKPGLVVLVRPAGSVEPGG